MLRTLVASRMLTPQQAAKIFEGAAEDIRITFASCPDAKYVTSIANEFDYLARTFSNPHAHARRPLSNRKSQ